MPSYENYQTVHGKPRPSRHRHKGRIRGKQKTASRYFDGAQSDRLLFGWDSHPASIEQVLRADLRSLRARCREQVRNNDYAKRFQNLLLANVVGPHGIQVQAKVSDTVNTALDAAWAAWGEDHCDVTGQLSFCDVQRLFISSMVHDGEFLCRFHRGEDYGAHNVQVEVIDPERIALDHENKRLANGNEIRLGVEFSGPKPVAVWLYDIDEDGDYQLSNAKRLPFMSDGKVNAIHCFLPEYVGQIRGIPWLSTALYRMKLLQGYDEAAITAARIGASKAGFFYSETGEAYTGDEENTDGSLLTDVEPGSFEQLPDGLKFAPYDPTYPHGEYEPFMKRTLMGMAAGLNIGYNAVANDPENTSYSTLRQFELENRDAYRTWQQCLIRFVRRSRNDVWLPMAQLAEGFDARMGLASLKPATFTGRRWDWVDPEKDWKGHKLALDSNATTVSQIIRDRGQDPEEVFKERAAELERMRELGIQIQPK